MPLAKAVPPREQTQRDPALQAHPGRVVVCAVVCALEAALCAHAAAYTGVPAVGWDGHREVSHQLSAVVDPPPEADLGQEPPPGSAGSSPAPVFREDGRVAVSLFIWLVRLGSRRGSRGGSGPRVGLRQDRDSSVI